MTQRSIKTKVLLPIIIFMIILTTLAFLRINTIITDILDNYKKEALIHEMQDIKSFANSSPSREVFLTILSEYVKHGHYIYKIKEGKNTIFQSEQFPSDYTGWKDGILKTENPIPLYGFKVDIKKFGLSVCLFREFPQVDIFQKDLNSTLSVFALTVLLMILSIMIVVRKNLVEPLKGIMNRINKGECALPTGIAELDDLVDVINDALATAELKTQQAHIFHNIALSLNKDMTFDEIMNTILEQSRVLIDANLSAIALYDESGRFYKLKVYGVDERKMKEMLRKLPDGKGILKLMQLSLSPVRINDLSKHPAFSGQFPEGHPEIKNFLGYPIFSKTGKPLGALYFANKRTGEFTEEDEEALMAIASDAAVAIQRVYELEELHRFKRIIDSAFDIIVITDRKGNIIYANPAFESLTGYSSKEVIGKDPSILKSGFYDNEFYQNLWNTILSGQPWKGEFINRKKNGELFTASTVIFPIFSEDNRITHFVSIQRDITEEKKLYEQLLRAQKMEAIGTLAGGIAHDFNNILTAILGYAELLRDYVGPEHHLSKAVQIIENSAKKGASLAARILNITRKEKMELTLVDINKVIHETLDILHRSIPKDINIQLILEDDLPPIKADPSQIQQVIMNLAINARDAMPEGGTLTIKTSKVGKENGAANGLRSDNGFIRLTVSDTGRGIEKDMQSKIFDPFFTTKDKGSGTGLGLYIVHSIVTNHGGYINLYSEPNQGTRFNIYFPSFKGQLKDEKEPDTEELKGSGTILVIDDEEEIRELTKDLLTPLGYNVVTASSGPEGVSVYRSKKDEIVAVVLDMIMPKMNGAEVFQRLQNIDPDVKVLLCSGYSNEGLAGIKELLRSGAKGFVQKPFTRKTLAKTLKEVLGK